MGRKKREYELFHRRTWVEISVKLVKSYLLQHHGNVDKALRQMARGAIYKLPNGVCLRQRLEKP
jgi:hypothetical protein